MPEPWELHRREPWESKRVEDAPKTRAEQIAEGERAERTLRAALWFGVPLVAVAIASLGFASADKGCEREGPLLSGGWVLAFLFSSCIAGVLASSLLIARGGRPVRLVRVLLSIFLGLSVSACLFSVGALMIYI